MAKCESCHNCVYSRWNPGQWLASLSSGFPVGPTCANQPDSPGRWKDCPIGKVCRNFRARPPIPKGENVKTIALTNGFYAYVDAEDYEWLNQWHWRAYSTGYAGRYEKGKLIYMHRQIMQPPKGMIVDHISGNGFDNTRLNMRNVTRRQNMYNKGKHVGTASIYKGVARDKRSGKWYAEIRWGDARRRSKLFEDEAEAARAYDRLAVEVFGEFARLNFPEEWPSERRAEVYAQRDAVKRRTEGRGRRTGGTREGKRKRVKGGSTKAKDKTARTGGKKGRKVAAGGKPGTGRRVKPKGGKPAATRRRSPPSNGKGRTKADKSSRRSRPAARKSLRGG